MTPPVSSFSTRRPVAVLMVFLAVVVFGFFSYSRLPITLMPELSYPTLTVRTEYPGAAPEEVENDVSRPIEDALGVVGGLTRISSVSRAGVGSGSGRLTGAGAVVCGLLIRGRSSSAKKGVWRMPWRQEAMKDVARCEKPWGAASRL